MLANHTPVAAAVCRQFGAPLQLETLQLSPPQAREARVRLFASSICHSDITYMEGGWGGAPPMVLGHEGAGVVEEAGAGCAFAVGARVVVCLVASCGACGQCKAGSPAMCSNPPNRQPRLFDSAGAPVAAGLKTGAFAEQVVVHESQLAAMDGDKDLSFDHACLLACGALTGWGSARRIARLQAGASAAVVGCGGVGVGCLQAAAAAGASPILAVDVSAAKLKLLSQFGATHTLQPQKANFAERARAIAANGFDYVFMAAGNARAAQTALALLGKGGVLVAAGMPPNGDYAQVDFAALAEGQHKIFGAKMGGARPQEDIPQLIKLHKAGGLNLRALVAARHRLQDINAAIAATKSGDTLRHVIVFD